MVVALIPLIMLFRMAAYLSQQLHRYHETGWCSSFEWLSLKVGVLMSSSYDLLSYVSVWIAMIWLKLAKELLEMITLPTLFLIEINKRKCLVTCSIRRKILRHMQRKNISAVNLAYGDNHCILSNTQIKSDHIWQMQIANPS